MKILIMCLIALISPAVTLQAAQVHAILVADTADGMSSFETNIDLMTREAKRIAAYNYLPLHLVIFEHYEVKRENVINFLENIKIENDDIVIFYINNHGVRNIDKTSQWPDLLFVLAHPSHSRIDYNEIIQLLQNKSLKCCLLWQNFAMLL